MCSFYKNSNFKLHERVLLFPCTSEYMVEVHGNPIVATYEFEPSSDVALVAGVHLAVESEVPRNSAENGLAYL